MKQLDLIILHGPPASGKSTYAKEWQQEDLNNRVIVCREDICNMLGVHPGGKNEFVDDLEKTIVEQCLMYNKNVIIDSTRKLYWEGNLGSQEFDLWHWEQNVKINFIYKEFGADLSVEELIERDRARGSKTGEDVIKNWRRK